MEINNSINDKNFYEILNIRIDSNSNEIKKSYKKLAIKYHPDKNTFQNCAEYNYNEKFSDILNAYSILSNKDKRFIYDRYGIFGINIYDNCNNKYFKKFLLYPNSIYFIYLIFSIVFSLLSCQIFLVSYNLDNSIIDWKNKLIPFYMILFIYIILKNIFIILTLCEIINIKSILSLILFNIKSLSIVLTLVFINNKLINNTDILLFCLTPLYLNESLDIIFVFKNYIQNRNFEESDYIFLGGSILRICFYFILVLKIDNNININWFFTFIPLYINILLYVFIKSYYTLNYIDDNDNDYEKIRNFKLTQTILISLLSFIILFKVNIIEYKINFE